MLCVWVCVCLSAGNIDGCSNDRTVYLSDVNTPRCPLRSQLAMLMFFVYILIMAIMLINLLIAMFRFHTASSNKRVRPLRGRPLWGRPCSIFTMGISFSVRVFGSRT